MQRLAVLKPHKAAVTGLINAFSGDPLALAAWNKVMVNSMQWMLVAANIGAEGPVGALVRFEYGKPLHQHVEKPFARRFARHVLVDAVENSHVGLPRERGKDRAARGKMSAQVSQGKAGLLGDVRKAETVPGALGCEGEQSFDDRAAGIGGRSVRFLGHRHLPVQ